MSTHKYDQVNPLVNPVRSADVILAESGKRYIVTQGMDRHYALIDALTTEPVKGRCGNTFDSQMGICSHIFDSLQNL